MTHRIEQAESTLQKALAQVLQRKIADPRIRGLVSITKIDISPDLKRADVFVSVMPDQYEKVTLAGLRAADRHIQSEVKKLVAMRVVPHLGFKLDDTIKKADAVLDAIGQAMARTPAPGSAPENQDAGSQPSEQPAPDNQTSGLSGGGGTP